MKRVSLFFLLILGFASGLYAQPSTYPLYQNIFGATYLNADSVRVDTTTGSPTFHHLFAKRYFAISFTYDIMPLDSVSSDSVLIVGISAINGSYSVIRTQFDSLQVKLGTISFQKAYPAIADSTIACSNAFGLFFANYVDVDTATFYLQQIPLTHVRFASMPYVNCVIPTDAGMIPGTPASALPPDGSNPPSGYATNFHPLGWEWSLYKMKCPMAWEITMGRPDVYILDADDWDYTTPSVNADLVPNFKTISANTDLGWPSLPLYEGHGHKCIGQAIAAAGNGYSMVGVAPKCKALGIGHGFGDPDYEHIDCDGLKNGIKTYADVIYAASGNPGDFLNMFNLGTVATFAAGNGLGRFNDGSGGSYQEYPTEFGPFGWGIFYIDNNPAHDIPFIGVTITMDGFDTYCPNAWSWSKEGAETIADYYSWSSGLEKFDQTSDPTIRGPLKGHAFVDLVAPGLEVLCAYGSPTSSTYAVESGTSFAAPEVAGVAALMKSIGINGNTQANHYLGVNLAGGIPTNGADVEMMAHLILTFTAYKIADISRDAIDPGTGIAIAQGFPASSSDVVYTSGDLDSRYASGTTLTPWQYDYNNNSTFLSKDVVELPGDGISRTLNRSWAQRVGFGRVNAYRAVANSIPVIGNYEYSSSTLHLGFTTAAENENSAFLMHFGAWKDATHKTLVAGGNIIPNQNLVPPYVAWPHLNQGQTVINSASGTPTVLTVGDDPSPGNFDILAIDGNLIGDGLANNKITTTSNGKILITGYLQDVEVTGATTKVDDLIIYSSGSNGYSNVTVGSGQTSEIYGVVQLQDNGNFIVNGGTLTIQPGGEIEMEGNNGFDILSGSHVIMEASSTIANEWVKVESGATLEIKGLLPASIFSDLLVESGGQVIIDAGATLQLDEFTVYSGGSITVLGGTGTGGTPALPGGRLTLNKSTTNTCLGTLSFEGVTGVGNRCTLTGGISACGQVDQNAIILVRGSTTLPTPSTDATINMVYTDDSDVEIKVQDALKYPFIHDCFSANSSFKGTSPNLPISTMLYVANSEVYPRLSGANPELTNIQVTNCRFFDELTGTYIIPAYHTIDCFYASNLYGASAAPMLIAYDTFYNARIGCQSYHCSNLRYSYDLVGLSPGSAASPMQHGITDYSSYGDICNSSIEYCVDGGIGEFNHAFVFLYDNLLYGNSYWELTAQNGNNCWVRGNSFSTFQQWGGWSLGAGSWIYLSDLVTTEYGKSQFQTIDAGNSADLVRGGNKASSLHGGGLSIQCGRNSFGSTESWHLVNNDPGLGTYTMPVQYNNFQSGGTVRQIRVTATGTPLNVSTTDPQTNCTDVIDLSPECTIPIGNPYPPTSEWFPTDSSSSTLKTAFWNARGMLLSDTNTDDIRMASASDEIGLAGLIDSSATYLNQALADFNYVLGLGTTLPDLKSSLWMMKGQIYEEQGLTTSAIHCYDTITSNYHQYTDSIYAVWSLQHLALPNDSTSSFDSLQNIYVTRVINDLISIQDTISGGGGEKMADGHPMADTTTLQVTVHPNPASGIVKVCVADLPGGIPVVVNVVNQMGASVATLYNATPEAELGLCLSLDCSMLPSGIYYADLQTEGTHNAVKFTVSH